MDTDSLLISDEDHQSTSLLLHSNHPSLQDRGQDEWRRRVTRRSRGIFRHPEPAPLKYIPKKYAYMFRQKSFWELVLISGTVCGLEFCYSAETAFVTPILLSLGLNMRFVTMIWCLSPLIGLFVTPILGSLSDNCRSKLGRRRPFILLYACGIILGLILVPNGHKIGQALGDDFTNLTSPSQHSSTLGMSRTIYRRGSLIVPIVYPNTSSSDLPPDTPTYTNNIQTWSIVFTAIGTIFMDFCADACQSPARTLVLDISHPEDHPAGLGTFGLMAGLGGSLGYMIGAVDWEQTMSIMMNTMWSQITIVFVMVGVVFVVCLLSTVFSFPEMPLSLLDDQKVNREFQERMQSPMFENSDESETQPIVRYGSIEPDGNENVPNGKYMESEFLSQIIEEEDLKMDIDNNVQLTLTKEPLQDEPLTFTGYLKSIVLMPTSLKILCLTDLFCWMSLLCYSLYFTDFVAEVVFQGDPLASEGSAEFKQYVVGVRYGCWGMAISSFSCAVYSLFLENLVKKIGSKKAYIGGQLVYLVGMILMAVVKHKIAVIILSATTGAMYATLFTMPYILIADYHSKNQFSKSGDDAVRGIGTDVATVSSMVFVAQIVLSMSMGSIVEAVGSSIAIVWAAAALGGCGALSATQVLYLN